MRYTSRNQFAYWIAGSSILTLVLPTNLLDVLVDPEWAAPNWQCDSLIFPIMQTIIFLIPWAIIATLISAGIVFLLVRKRQAGADIFSFDLGAWGGMELLRY